MHDEPIDESFEDARARMVRSLRDDHDISDERVLEAMATVPRHRFVARHLRDWAYGDNAMEIGSGQRLAQPLMIATITAAASLQPGQRVLHIGAGSGYHLAVLARMGLSVISLERVPKLARRAASRMGKLGHDDVEVHLADGRRGWPDGAPYDAVLCMVAVDEIPAPWLDQLREDSGRVVAPVGHGVQDLTCYRKTPDGPVVTTHGRVGFTPIEPGVAREAPSRRG